MLDTTTNRVNGLDLTALGDVVEAINADPKKALVSFDVTTRWDGQTRSETTVDGYTLGGERIARSHTIVADEPCELLGSDGAPNPQELLMAAFNACITVGYVAGASVNGIKLDSLEIKLAASSTCAASSASATPFRRATNRSPTRSRSRATAPPSSSRRFIAP